ncbi:hypothetical protein Tco_1005470 [Tanacetum coccineum]|uniref:Uncharacterized protein n=1 Tax=Tanacetum coccineum TaxID=301880 RepID=A0ABQ5FF86_9ASTR
MVPRTVLTRSGPISVKFGQPRTAVNNAGPMKNVINNAYSSARRPFNKIIAANNGYFTKKVNTAKGTRVNTTRPKVVLSVVKENKGNAGKALCMLGWRPKLKVRPCLSTMVHHVPLKDLTIIDAQGNQNYKKLMDGFVALEVIPKEEKLLGKPVVAGNQSNGNACTKACDASKARMETVPGKDYILLPMWHADLLFSQNSKDYPDARFKPSGEEEKIDTEDPGNENAASGKNSKVPRTEEPREDQRVNQELDASINNTNNINTAMNGK